MSQAEKLYEEVPEANEMIVKLCEKYPDELWAVRPDTVTVLAITNKDKSEKNKVLAKIKPIKGGEKALFQLNNILTRYIIEIYGSDWSKWTLAQKLSVIFHELLHIDSEIGKTVRHDVEDFRLMVDKLGVNWFNDTGLPNLLDMKVEFDLSMRANVPEDGDLKIDSGDEIIDLDQDQDQDQD